MAETTVELRFRGQFDAGRIEDELSISPAASWQVGETVLLGSRRRHIDSGFAFASTLPVGASLGDHVVQIGKDLPSSLARWRSTGAGQNVDVVLSCAVYLAPDERPDISLSHAALSYLTALNADLEIDVYPDYLGPLRPTDAEEYLRHLSSQRSEVRATAALSLGDARRSTRVVAALRNALNDANPAVRSHATQSLGRLGDVRSVDKMVDVLNGLTPRQGWTAARGLVELATNTRATAKTRERVHNALSAYHARSRGQTRRHAELLISQLPG